VLATDAATRGTARAGLEAALDQALAAVREAEARGWVQNFNLDEGELRELIRDHWDNDDYTVGGRVPKELWR
jgi:hypothetical protein